MSHQKITYWPISFVKCGVVPYEIHKVISACSIILVHEILSRFYIRKKMKGLLHVT